MKQPSTLSSRFKRDPLNDAAVNMAGTMSVKDICLTFGISERRLRAAAAYRKISLAFDRALLKKPWTAEEEGTLKKLAGTHTTIEVAKLLGRTEASVMGKARLMSVSFRKYGEHHPNAKHSDHDIELCRQLADAGLRPYEIAQKMEIEMSHLCRVLKFEARAYPAERAKGARHG